MKNNNTKGYMILGILFALVSIIALVVSQMKTAAFWIAYAFTVIALAAQIGIWKVALGKEGTLKSKFLGFPVIHIGIIYLGVQLVVFAVVIFVPMLPIWSTIVLCTIIIGISAVCMIASEAGRDEIERVEIIAQKKIFYIRELQANVELLVDNEKNVEIKTALMRLLEKIRYSDPMSSEQLKDLEGRISAKVAEMKTATNITEIIAELNSLLDERNKKCKILK